MSPKRKYWRFSVIGRRWKTTLNHEIFNRKDDSKKRTDLRVQQKRLYRCNWYDCLRVQVNSTIWDERKHLPEFDEFCCEPILMNQDSSILRNRPPQSSQCDFLELQASLACRKLIKLVVEFELICCRPNSIVWVFCWGKWRFIFVSLSSWALL